MQNVFLETYSFNLFSGEKYETNLELEFYSPANTSMCTFFCQKLADALLESAEGREWSQKIFLDQSPQKTVARTDKD